MKQRWTQYSERFDALSLRERLMVFGAAAVGIVYLVHFAWLDPMFSQQKALQAKISQTQNNIAGIDGEIEAAVRAYSADPDAPDRQHLAQIHEQIEQLDSTLHTMQKGLVAPERMAMLLETILKSHGRLRLLSLKTLPVSGLSEVAAESQPKEVKPAAPVVPQEEQVANNLKLAMAGGAPKQDGAAAAAAPGTVPATAPGAPAAVAPAAAKAAPKPPELLYRHGVELTVQGRYLDMVDYMSALEAMPTQLFWGKARLEVAEFPNARLTLTLYTMSLDKKWMKL
jgi:MSHA biogenesis protein MshJ